MARRRPLTHAELLARMPRAFRPKLTRQQVTDLALVHIVNLDDIAAGRATGQLLWDLVESVLAWSRAAELARLDTTLMRDQLELIHRMIERYNRTGLVRFTGPDYQAAKDGVAVMDALANTVDKATAIEATEWARVEVDRIAEQARQRQVAGERRAA